MGVQDEIVVKLKAELKVGPKRLDDLDQWLYAVVNTARAMIDNTSKEDLGILMRLAECDSTSQIQQEFDIIQGKFGREGFSQRHSRSYLLLCSLVADFPDQKLSYEDKERIRQYSTVSTYLLYEL